MNQPKTISSAEISEICGYTERRLRQLADEGYFPKAERGEWNLPATIQGLLRFVGEKKSPALERLNEAKLEAQQRKNRIAEKLENKDYMATAEVSGLLEIGIKAIELVPAKMESEFGLQATQTKRLQQLLDEARSDWARTISGK